MSTEKEREEKFMAAMRAKNEAFRVLIEARAEVLLAEARLKAAEALYEVARLER